MEKYMIKYTIALLSVILGLTACTSCIKKNQVLIDSSASDASVSDAPVEATSILDSSNPIIISNNNWQFTLPSDEWKLTSSDDGGSETYFLYENKKEKSLLFFVKEPFNGLTQDYALIAVRGLKESNLNLRSSSQLVIDAKTFVYLELFNDNIKIYQIMLSQDKFGYSLSCGGLDIENVFKEKCMTIFKSLKIK